MAQGWVAGEKRGGSRWLYRPAVSRSEGLHQFAERAVEAFRLVEPSDGWYLGACSRGWIPEAVKSPIG